LILAGKARNRGDTAMLTGTAVILAGGNSSRMGFDKQYIKLNGKRLIEQQIQVLQNIFSEIIIVTNKPELYKDCACEITKDQLQNFGPMGGIHAGLKAAQSQFSYFIACDMPNINQAYILHMLKRINKESYGPQAVITRFGDWLEPFNAFYSKDVILLIEQAYKVQTKKISSMLENAQVHYIEEAEARSFSPDWRMFANINTQQDLNVLEGL
jgi:molybdopterin-guanine dinucleotide biosynthesis protein A